MLHLFLQVKGKTGLFDDDTLCGPHAVSIPEACLTRSWFSDGDCLRPSLITNAESLQAVEPRSIGGIVEVTLVRNPFPALGACDLLTDEALRSQIQLGSIFCSPYFWLLLLVSLWE